MIPSSSRKQLVQGNASKCHMSSLKSKDDLLRGTDPDIPEIIRKIGRKVPMRPLDFISDVGHETNPDDKHITIAKCLRQSHKSMVRFLLSCHLAAHAFSIAFLHFSMFPEISG